MPGKRRKHVPLRTCIVCQRKRSKRELVRIVCTPEGSIEIDPRGKRPGRGAYLCPEPSCWSAALHPGKLGQALRCHVRAEDLAALRDEAALLLQGRTEEDGPKSDRRLT